MKTYFVYIAANEKDGKTYIGVTNDIIRRIVEHKTKQVKGYTAKHNIDKLVWYQETDSIEGAILKEKQIKKWNRDWKIAKIEKTNAEWDDLFNEIGGSDEMLESVRINSKQ